MQATVRAPRRAARETAWRLALLGAALAAVVFAHREALAGMVARWNGSPMYSFGYIVPAVSLFLLWARRPALRGLRVAPSTGWGLSLTCAVAVALLGGQLAGVQVIQQLAFVLAVVGGVVLLFGTTVFRRTWVAWGYLLLMVPFWDGLTEPLHLPFQRLSALVGVRLLHLVGVPAYHEGTLLYLPSLTIEVARACSGINYVVAVVALGIPLAYLYLSGVWRRVVLIGGAVVIAAVSNSLRVALIGMLSYWGVGAPLHGPLHVLHGLFVSGVGYVALFMGLWLLMPSRERVRSLEPPSAQPPSSGSWSPWTGFNPGTALALAAVFLALSAAPSALAPKPVANAVPLDALPRHLDGWASTGAPPVPGRWWDGADQEAFLVFVRPGDAPVEVAIAWYGVQKQGRELVNHRLNILSRGSSKTSLPLGPRESADVNLVRTRLGDRDRIGLFWYQIDGRPIARGETAKLLTFWSVLRRGRNDGLIVVLLSDRTGSEVRQLEGLKDLAARLRTALVR